MKFKNHKPNNLKIKIFDKNFDTLPTVTLPWLVGTAWAML